MKIITTDKLHQPQIEALLDQCFGSDRLSRTSYAIRHGTIALPQLSFVIIDDDDEKSADHIIATIACWPICLRSDKQCVRLIMVGPIAVSPYHQNMGYGRQLVNHVIEASRKYEKTNLIMIGDPEYYGQFGFAALPHADWQLPGPYEKHRLLSRGNAKLPSYGILGPCAKEDL